MRLPSIGRLLSLARSAQRMVRKARETPTPGWALPTCPQCRVTYREENQGRLYVCPKCDLEYDPRKKSTKPLLNEGVDFRGEL